MFIHREPKHLLVTGGCGFVGSAFIRWLLRQPQFEGTIVNLDLMTYAANAANVADVPPDRYLFVHGDIADARRVEGLCREHRIDTLVHFAAESHVDRSIHGPGVFMQTNILGTYQLLEVTRALGDVHFHHVSTDEVYGSLGPTGYFTENTPYHPNSPYSASKAAADHLVRAYAHTYGLSITVSNCSNNYGPYQFPEKLIPLMTLNLLENQPLPIYGTGSNVRDWLYVDDHAEALWTILQGGPSGETFNVGGEAESTNLALVQRLIQIVADLTGRDPEVLAEQIRFVADRPGHDLRYAIDCSKLKSQLGWTQRHDLVGGLRETVRWYLQNPSWVADVRNGSYLQWLEQNYGARG